ncbi:MAG: diguanylate cyclase [Candidatus Izimaplasma sp.]|nr:diguanylate cyclase [Candidatus Izimaplasma bacterium]
MRTTLLVGAIDFWSLVLGFFIAAIALVIIYSMAIELLKRNKQLKTESEFEKFSSIRVLENYTGMAFSCDIDRDWTMRYLSSNTYQILGYTNEELLDNSVISYNEIIHPKYRKYVHEKYEEAIRNHDDVVIEYKIINKDKQEIWVREEGVIIYDKFNNPQSIEGFIYNITAIKELRYQKNIIELRYNSLFDSIDFPIVVIKKAKIVDVNPAGLTFFRASTKSDMVGKDPMDFIDNQYLEFYETRMKRLKDTKTANLSTNYKFKRLDNTKVVANVTATPYFEKGEMIVNAIILEKDNRNSFNQQLRKTERRNRDLILYMHEGIGVFQVIPDELDGKLVFQNKRFSEFVYGKYQNLIYKRFSEIFPSTKENDLQIIFDQTRDKPYKREVRNTETNRHYQFLFYFNRENELITQITDLTKEKETTEKYLQEKQKLDDILESTGVNLWEWNLRNDSLSFDERWLKSMGYSDKDYNQFDFYSFEKLIHKDDYDYAKAELVRYFRNEIKFFSLEVRIKDKYGHYRYGLIRGKASEYNRKGRPIVINGTFQDTTANKEKEAEIKFLSLHDHLTKLYNLRAYENAITKLDNKKYYPVSLAIADVNGLKVFNDALSHAVGDKLLVKTANIFTKNSKEADFVARIGGDEFVIIMPNTSNEQANNRLLRIEKELNQEKIADIPISISFGVETKTKEGFTLKQIKDLADSKMYQQKFSGKDTRLQILEQILENFYKANPFEEKVVNQVNKLSLELIKKITDNQELINEVDIASQYYNIGIFSIRDDVFNDVREFEENQEIEYKKHVENGYRIMLATYRSENISKAILYHHEKYNGEGYPSGLKGKDIPLTSRIIAIAATYARKQLLGEKNKVIFAYLNSQRDISFDPELVDEFIKMIK